MNIRPIESISTAQRIEEKNNKDSDSDNKRK